MSHNLKIPHVFINDISQQNIVVDKNFNMLSSASDYSNEQMMFDTIVVRRPTGTTGDSNGTYYINLRELQMWVNNSNVLPSSAGSGNNTENTPYDDISNQTTFIDWSTKESDGNYNNLTTYQVSNIYDEDINSTSLNIGNILSKNNYLSSVYIPLTTQYNINNIQSFVLYNRNTGVTSDYDRTQGLAIELYNRSIDSTLSNPIISTPEIDVTANIYRFDFPSLYTYNSFVSSDSSTNIIDSANSAVYNVLSKKEPYIEPTMKFNFEEEERLFDTIVIRRPTGYSGSDYYINLRELQVWVDNLNVLLTSACSGNNVAGDSYDEISNKTTFMFWNTKISDTHFSTSAENQVSNIFDNIINSTSTSFHSVGDVTSSSTNSLISIYIPLTIQYNINNIQSFVLYNRTDNNSGQSDRTQGLAIELYNRTNDPSLNVILASTKIISQTANVYRFDFAGISSYTKAFIDEDSTTNIVSSSYATTEITEEKNNNPTGFRIENGGLHVDSGLQVNGDTTLGTLNNNFDLIDSMSPKFFILPGDTTNRGIGTDYTFDASTYVNLSIVNNKEAWVVKDTATFGDFEGGIVINKGILSNNDNTYTIALTFSNLLSQRETGNIQFLYNQADGSSDSHTQYSIMYNPAGYINYDSFPPSGGGYNTGIYINNNDVNTIVIRENGKSTNTGSLWINGILQTTYTYTEAQGDASNKTLIGHRQNYTENPGLVIHSVIVWDSALSDSQVSLLTPDNVTLGAYSNCHIYGNLNIDNHVSCQQMDVSGNTNINGNIMCNNIDEFDTIVIRKSSGYIILWELQCWVNNINILASNSSQLTSYFAYWDTDKETDVGNFGGGSPASRAYDNDLTNQAHSNNNVTSLIIKNIPLTRVSDIQSILYYNRANNNGNYFGTNTYIEVYHSSDYTTPLARTPQTNSLAGIYRFDFPGISNYTNGYANSPSTTQIISENGTTNYSLSKIELQNGINFNYHSGNLDVSGNLTIDGSLKYDTDAFHYQHNAGVQTTTGNLVFNYVKFGSSFLNSTYFVAKYSGYYSLTLCLFLTSGSTGDLRIGVKINDSVYYGSSSTYPLYFMSTSNAVDKDQYCGTIIIPLSKGDKVNPYVALGTLKYFGHHSYFSGYCISII